LSCRAAALEAQAKKDFETFHDLAWMAYRKGRPDDPEAMLLLARAQSLSGRPGDALVMLDRLAARGVESDAATSEDFANVRALPGWTGDKSSAASSPVASPAPVPPKSSEKRPAAPAPSAAGSNPVISTAKPAPRATSAPDPATTAPDPAGKVPAAPVVSPPASTTVVPSPSAAGAAASRREPGAPLKFTTLLTPSALAYDAVSRRYIIADRVARRVAVIDENTGQVATLVGAQGALGEIGGIAIDPQQGDLWVVASDGDGLRLHRMQLISGRVLSSAPLKGPTDPVVALAFARNVGLVLSDASGIIWRVRADGRSDKLTALEYVPRALAADAEGRLYVGAGSPRLARFALAPSMRKLDVVELAPGVPTDAPFAILGNRVGVVVASEGAYEIRTIPLRRR
jgi:hypothetical protein